MALKFTAGCDRIKLLLWQTSKIFRSIKTPDLAWKLYFSRGKERLTPRRIPRESSISRNVPISTWVIARVWNRRDFPIAQVLRLAILKHRARNVETSARANSDK